MDKHLKKFIKQRKKLRFNRESLKEKTEEDD